MHIYREEAAILDFTQNSSFPAKRRQRHAKVNFGDNGKRETSNRQQTFAVCRKRDAKGLFLLQSGNLEKPPIQAFPTRIVVGESYCVVSWLA